MSMYQFVKENVKKWGGMGGNAGEMGKEKWDFTGTGVKWGKARELVENWDGCGKCCMLCCLAVTMD